jgi:hypothetical protein
MVAPQGQIRGPAMKPSSMARLRPKVGPPRSRTEVKPRCSISSAARPVRSVL